MADTLAFLSACGRAVVSRAAGSPDPERVRRAAATVDDWTTALDAAEAHGMLALVWRELQEAGVPVDRGADSAADRRRRIAARALGAVGELVAVMRVLAQAGVAALPYKGPALALDAYGDAALRDSDDIDVVVAPHDADAAAAALLAAGWRTTGGPDWRTTLAANAWRGHAVLTRDGGAVPVELHWRFCNPRLPWNPDVTAVLARTRQAELGGAALPIPAREDQLLLVLLHAARHGWDQLESIVCAAALAARGFDAHLLRERAGGVGGLVAVAAGLEAGRRVLELTSHVRGADLGAALGAAKPDARIGRFAERAMDRLRRGSSGTHRDAWLQLALLERWADRARFVARTALTPTPADRDTAPLPRTATPLRVPLRVVHVLRRAWQAWWAPGPRPPR